MLHCFRHRKIKMNTRRRKHWCLCWREVSSRSPVAVFLQENGLLFEKNPTETHTDDLFLSSMCLTVCICQPPCMCMRLYLLSKWMCLCVCVYAGPALPLHILVVGVHRHCHHLHHHPPRRHRPAADAHSQVLLLGHQPVGVQWNHPQRSWYVQACTQFAQKGTNTVRKKKPTTRDLMTLLLTLFLLYIL